jgi:alpha-glucosidase
VIYQVYPRSFADSNGDGIGDLPGLLGRLDHLAGTDLSLGVDAIWLSPMFPSPMADFGYDVSDFTEVAREFGSLADLDRLIAECHARGLRLLLDLVPCHTSLEHPWFFDSRSSRSSARRDWYSWADPSPDGGPPNNWRAGFGGPSWTFDETTRQYYLHSFYPEQPDLNWRNPEVAAAIAGVIRFWFDRGIDGFRVDAITHAMKDPQLRDNPPAIPPTPPFPVDATGQYRIWNMDRPEVVEVVRSLQRVADEYPGRLLVGEAFVPADRLAAYLGGGAGDGFARAFDFELSLIDWSAAAFSMAIERAERYTPAGLEPTWALSNHDLSRHATRFGARRSRLAALILLTLRGTICLYAGEEIGMVDAEKLPGPPLDRAGRDAQRTPMQWDASPTGGFTTGRPWLPLVDPRTRNVAAQRADPESLLGWYRQLLGLRRSSTALRHGSLTLHALHPYVLAFTRQAGDERLLVLANLGDAPATVGVAQLGQRAAVLVATGDCGAEVDLTKLKLAACEGIVVRL